jgi:hypothetical protein
MLFAIPTLTALKFFLGVIGAIFLELFQTFLQGLLSVLVESQLR